MWFGPIMKKDEKPIEAAGSKHEKSRRQLDFDKKKKSGSLSKKVFYLDIKDARRLRNLEGKLKQLGGTVEKFLSKEVNYIITSNANLSKQKQDKQGGTGDSPNTPNASTPSPFNMGQSPSPSAMAELRKIENIPRGKTLAKIAGGQQSPNTVLENAEKIGIKVVSYEQTIKYVEKEIAKLKVLPEPSKQPTKKKPITSRNKVQTLRDPFIKFEAENCHYRPIVQELESWPHLNVETPRGTCPFDGRPLTHAQCSERAERDMNAERILSPDNPKCPGLDTPNTPQDEVKRTCGKVNEDSTSKLVGFPILTAGELRRDRDQKRRAARRQGYCEACKEKYNNIDQHLLGEHHRQFVRNKANFTKLDELIESGPSTATFISSVILRHCVLKAQEKPKSHTGHGHLECETTPTDESDFKMEQMQTPKKKAVALNLNQNPYSVGDDTSEHRKALKEPLQPLQMIEMSQGCPKHKKDRSLCRCTDVLSSLSRQLAQSCSPNHTSQRHTKETNELQNVNFHSTAVVKNTSCRGLYGSPSRFGLRRSFQKSSKQAMVIGNSQIASLQTLRNVCSSDRNVHISSNNYSSEDGDIIDNCVPQDEVRPIDETTKTEDSAYYDKSTDLADPPVMQPSEDCILKSPAKDIKKNNLLDLSDQNVNRESVDRKKQCFVAKEKFRPVNLKCTKVQNSSMVSRNVNIQSSDVHVNEHSLQTADSTVLNEAKQECKINAVSSKHQSNSEQTTSQNQSLLNKKQTSTSEGKKTTTTAVDKLQSSTENSAIYKEELVDCTKAHCFTNEYYTKADSNSMDFKMCGSHRLPLQKHTKEKSVTDQLLFYESAAERVKNRRARSSSVVDSNTPTGSVCDMSENYHSSRQRSKNKGKVKSQKHKSRHWSGSSSKPLKETTVISQSVDNELNRKKPLGRLKVNKTHLNVDVKHKNISLPITKSKEIFLDEKSLDISTGSLSPKYKKKSNHCKNNLSEDCVKNVLNNEHFSSGLSKSTSPVFKKSPRYCKKTYVPISPLSFRNNAAKVERKKEKQKIKDITKHSGFLRTPGLSVRSIKFRDNRDLNVNLQLDSVRQLDNGVHSNVELLLSPNRNGLNEDGDLEKESPKSGYSTTPCGKSLARRKLYTLDDTLNSKGHKRRRLKFNKRKNMFEEKKPSPERAEKCELQHTDNLASEDISCQVLIKNRDHSEPGGKINILSPIQANNCFNKDKTLLSNSVLENSDRQASRKSKKRKWREANSSTSAKAGSSSKKIKLNRSWFVLSERSMSKLLESEADPPSFYGYNKQLSESKLPSDLTYEELSEVELSDNSDKEWILEDCSNRSNNNTAEMKTDESLEEQEESFKELLPLFTSPGKTTDSSWGDACDIFLKSACEKLTSSTPYHDVKQRKKKAVKEDKNSSRRKSENARDRTDLENTVHMPDSFDLKTPPKRKRSQKKVGLNDIGVKQVDEDIVFNFCSPQKDKREFSPLRKEDVYVCLDKRYDSQSCKTPRKLEQDSSPNKNKNKDHKRRLYSQHCGKNALKVKKSICADLDVIKRTSSKFKKERFS